MKFVYTGKDMEVSDGLQTRVEKKVGKLERYFKEEPEAIIRLTMQKGGKNKAEITLNAAGLMLRAEESTRDMYLSIDQAVNKLESQIRRHRTKLEKRIRVNIVEEEAPAIEEQTYDVVKVKKFPVKSMTVDDAITQMELLGHDFFLFENDADGIMNVIYRRSDGTYGLIKPE